MVTLTITGPGCGEQATLPIAVVAAVSWPVEDRSGADPGAVSEGHLDGRLLRSAVHALEWTSGGSVSLDGESAERDLEAGTLRMATTGCERPAHWLLLGGRCVSPGRNGVVGTMCVGGQRQRQVREEGVVRAPGWLPAGRAVVAGAAVGPETPRPSTGPEAGHRERGSGILEGLRAGLPWGLVAPLQGAQDEERPGQSPKSVQAGPAHHLHQIWMAPTEEEAEVASDYCVQAHGAKYPKAVEGPTKEREGLLAFCDLQAQQWTHIQTTSLVDSTSRREATPDNRNRTPNASSPDERLPFTPSVEPHGSRFVSSRKPCPPLRPVRR